MTERPTLQSEYKRITKKSWAESPATRLGTYKVMSYESQLDPARLPNFISGMLVLFDREDSAEMKKGVLDILGNRLELRQRDFGEHDFRSFFSALTALMMDEKAQQVPELIGLGLDVALRERERPTCGQFFSNVVSYVAQSAGRPCGLNVRELRDIMPKISTVACMHPELITPKYVDACCAVLAIPAAGNRLPETTRKLHKVAKHALMNLIKEFDHPDVQYAQGRLFSETQMRALRNISRESSERLVKQHIRHIQMSLEISKMRAEKAVIDPPDVPDLLARIVAERSNGSHKPSLG